MTRFLTGELASISDRWSLLAVGRQAFNALAHRFPERAVLGIPHPTGSRGNFTRLMDVNQVRPEYQRARTALFRNGVGQAIWVDET